MTEPAAADQTDIGTEFVRQADHPNEAGLTAFEADLASKTGSKGDSKAAALQLDRAALSAKLWEIAEHHIIAEWICCEPLEPRHDLCAKGYAALGMAKTLLVDSPEAWNPNAPLLDAVLAMLPATAEEHRLALSDALGLGTGAPWDAIHDRATELGLPPLDRDPVARRLGLVAAPADRATVLNEAADHLGRQADELWAPGTKAHTVMHADAEELRRMAAESTPADTGHDGGETPFITRVLALFAQADAHGDLLWHVIDGRPEFAANVSDVFAWGGADAEDITPDTLPVLEQAFADLKAIDAEHFTADLYAARLRQMRPQGAAYPDSKTKSWREVSALYDACGPEREVGLGNPKAAPAHKQPAAAQQPICKCPAEICRCGHHKAQQPKKTPPPTGYSDGKGRVFCLPCAPSVGADVPLTINDVNHWDLCPSCGRHVIDVARSIEEPQS